ncbi:hypothetical protein F5884DRAFT_310233 [Xylogone sp. PMI_703]|nr:hypothetical protein F5884DRAFT_310233 [Xylogone sp. PMI_703]
MESCWFKLKQTNTPVPKIDSLGTGKETAPVCLGHIIPDLQRLDQAINKGSIEPFPNSMHIWETSVVGFDWSDHAAAANTQTVFRRSRDDFSTFRYLDSVIVEPTKAYVEKCLKHSAVATHIEEAQKLHAGRWSMFMITGIMVAKIEPSGSESDFIWAIRLAKIHGGAERFILGLKSWISDTEDEGETNVTTVVKAEGLKKFEVVRDDDLGATFVV